MSTKNGVSIDALYRPFARPIREQLHDFERPIPSRLVRFKEVDNSGHKVGYIPWFIVKRLADRYSPGWDYEVVEEGPVIFKRSEGRGKNKKWFDSPHFLVKVKITIYHSVGDQIMTCSRYGTGAFPIHNAGYGDPYTNAEAKALRRGFAKFGLGLSLYQGEGYKFVDYDPDAGAMDDIGDLPDDMVDEESYEEDSLSDSYRERGELATQKPRERKFENVPASTLYEIAADAGLMSDDHTNEFTKLVFGFTNTPVLSRISPEERNTLFHIFYEIRSTLKRVDERRAFLSWIVANGKSISTPESVYSHVDHWVDVG